MCTAVTYKTRDFYFGRTLDYEFSYSEEVTVTPRNFPFLFRHMGPGRGRYAMIGMARVSEGIPLYFDAVNEKGLAMAGLNFVGYAKYGKKVPDRDNVAHFELIPWLLCQCATVEEARRLLERVNITDTAFSRELPPAQLHWLLADRESSVTVEAVEEGLRVYPNPVGVLTNNPPFPQQVLRLTDFMHLSPEEPHNQFSKAIDLQPYSRGMGAMGLPGDWSSGSRFVRAAFGAWNASSGTTEAEHIAQVFHILGTVEQVKGCCRLGDGKCEVTLYTSCCNTDKGIYYYTTYDNHRITAVNMRRETLDGASLIRYPLVREAEIHLQN